MCKTLDQYQLSCKEERLELTKIQLQRVRLKALVNNFQNNKEYVKIRNTVEEKVHSVLSDRKMLLKLALLSITESMRKDPDRYISLIYHNKTWSNADYNSQNYDAASYGQQQYPVQAYMDILIEEAERLYNKLIKELVDEIITDYSSNISSSLPLLLPANEEQQSHQRQTTSAIQSHMHTEEDQR